jgi:PPE-repeat protein
MAVCGAASAWIRVGQIQAAEVAAAHTAAVETMIPAAVCLTNRGTQAGLIATNWFGQNTPGIIGLEAQYQGFWVTNATARTGYGSVVSTALGALSEPPPLAPTASDPLGPAVGVAQAAAQDGAQSGLQASAKSMTQVADAPAKDAMSAPGSAQGLMTSMAGQAGGLFGQLGSAFGQVTAAGQQLPSMLGQAPQMMSGLLGPLGSMQGLGGASAAALAPETAAPVSLSGVGAVAGGGGGGGGLLSGSSALSTTFVRPANSFSSPNAPTLPGGWQPNAEAESQARPAGIGGGGLYGAPPPMGRDAAGAPAPEKASRTMQVTARSGAGRGEGQRA